MCSAIFNCFLMCCGLCSLPHGTLKRLHTTHAADVRHTCLPCITQVILDLFLSMCLDGLPHLSVLVYDT